MDQQAKQQVIDRIKTAEHILVTVSTNPTVDQLAACVGTALLMNKLQKHATAVFSGTVPSTLEFLQPEKTLETNTDSLRDFIISLDKNKADKLRYKVEDKVVRIYITPYRTSIGQQDLEFTQGEYNVDLILALGVKDKANIDAAISAHGKILHDAATVCVNAGQEKATNAGQINWQDPTASSLSEMIVSISEALGTGLIDNQIATAFLTGIVAETNRFSNSKTTSKVMTMSAQLMAAGANQQLIATKLAEPPPEPPPSAKPVPNAPKKPSPAPTKDSGEITIDHDLAKDAPKLSPEEIRIDNKGNIEKAQELLKKKQETEQMVKQPGLPMPTALTRAGGAPPPDTAPVAPAPTTPPLAPLPPTPVTTPVAGAEPAVTTFRHEEEHALFDVPKPGAGSPFSAAGQSEEAWYDPMSADKNLAADAAEPNGGFISKAPDVQPPAETAPTNPLAPPDHVDNVRSAVESAYSTAQPPADLHTQQTHQPAVAAASTASMPAIPSVESEKPAPPTVPPPLPFTSAPAPAPSPAHGAGPDRAQTDPNSPNQAWPL